MRDLVELELLREDLLGVGLELRLWLSSIGEGLPHLLGGIVVGDIQGGAESFPFLFHFLDFLLSLLFILFGLDYLFSLLLLSKLFKLLLGLLLLLLELREDLGGVLLLQLVLLDSSAVSIRGMSKSQLTILARDIESLLLSGKFS